jgi:hypothetical protein
VRAQRRGRFQVMLTVLRLFLARQLGDLRAVVGRRSGCSPPLGPRAPPSSGWAVTRTAG